MKLSEFSELINEASKFFQDDLEIIIYDSSGDKIEPSSVIRHLTGDNKGKFEVE